MKRALPWSLTALALIVVAALALSLSIAPTLAQDGSTPTATALPDAGGAGTGDTGAEPGPQFIGGAEASEGVQLVLTYLDTADAALLAPDVQYRDFTQMQGLSTSQDVLGPANYLNTVFSEQEYTIRRVLTVENTVVVEFDFTGLNTGPFMGAAPTQQSVTVPMVAIFELGAPAGADQTSMVITRFDLYYDAGLLAQSLGFTLQGPPTGDADDADDVDGTDDADDADDTGDDATEGVTGLAPSITVENQAISEDGTVLIARLTIPVNGWVDIHADDSGAPGEIIGYAQVAAGEMVNVPVPIDGSRTTGTLWAMLHVDEGESGVHEFPGPDVPITDAQGNVVVVPFQVTPPDGASPAAEPTATPVDGGGGDDGAEATATPVDGG